MNRLEYQERFKIIATIGFDLLQNHSLALRDRNVVFNMAMLIAEAIGYYTYLDREDMPVTGAPRALDNCKDRLLWVLRKLEDLGDRRNRERRGS
jgi:hypothetical protein